MSPGPNFFRPRSRRWVEILKLAGSLLLIVSGTLVGFKMADRFSKRCRNLKTFLFLMEILKVEIYFQARMLPEVFRRAACQAKDYGLLESLNQLAEAVEFGSAHDFAEVWSLFLEQPEFNGLLDPDKQVLKEFGNNLGTTNRQDQLDQINRCRANLQLLLEQAEEDRQKRSGLYRYSGFALGTILVLWLV